MNTARILHRILEWPQEAADDLPLALWSAGEIAEAARTGDLDTAIPGSGTRGATVRETLLAGLDRG